MRITVNATASTMSSSSNLGDATTNLTSPRAFTPALAKMANIVERLTLLAYARAILAHQALDNIISEICLPIHVVLSRCVRRTTIATCTRDQVRVLVTLPALRRSNDCPYFAFVPDMVPFCLRRKFYILSAHWLVTQQYDVCLMCIQKTRLPPLLPLQVSKWIHLLHLGFPCAFRNITLLESDCSLPT